MALQLGVAHLLTRASRRLRRSLFWTLAHALSLRFCSAIEMPIAHTHSFTQSVRPQWSCHFRALTLSLTHCKFAMVMPCPHPRSLTDTPHACLCNTLIQRHTTCPFCLRSRFRRSSALCAFAHPRCNFLLQSYVVCIFFGASCITATALNSCCNRA